MAGWLTPYLHKASWNRALRSSSRIPGRSSSRAATSAPSVIEIAMRMQSTSAGSLTARTPRRIRSPSTSRAEGASIGIACPMPVDMPSTPMQVASERPGMLPIAPKILRGFHISCMRLSCGTSAGIPSSQVVASRWTCRVASTTVHIGAHDVTTDRQIGRCPVTYRGVAAPTEHEHVDALGLHGREHALAPVCTQRCEVDPGAVLDGGGPTLRERARPAHENGSFG